MLRVVRMSPHIVVGSLIATAFLSSLSAVAGESVVIPKRCDFVEVPSESGQLNTLAEALPDGIVIRPN